VLQLRRPVDMPLATRTAVARGVWLRPFRDLVYAMPPYPTDDADLARVTDAMLAVAAAHDDA
jgi:adenosylmethionine-8-amino-7-oxononanoate aminotransferase